MLVRTSKTPLAAPVITKQPVSISSELNGLASFWVEAEGIGLGYRWLKDGEPIYSEFSAMSGLGSEASTPCLRLQDLSEEQAGVYTVEVFNGVGSVVSEPVTLTVEEAYGISGNVNIENWSYFNGPNASISTLNTVLKIYKVIDGKVAELPYKETLVRPDGRYCFEVGYNGDVMNIDDAVARKFVPRQYMLEATVRSEEQNYTTTQMVEITNTPLTMDLTIENVPSNQTT